MRPRRSTASQHDADIGAPFLDAAHDLPDLALFETDAHVAIALGEQADIFRQHLGHRRFRGEHPHMALHTIGESAEFGLHPVEQLQRLACVTPQRFARRRHRDTASAARSSNWTPASCSI